MAIAPHTVEEAAAFAGERDYPFPMLCDPGLDVFRAYDVQSKLASLGQRPAVFVIDAEGVVRFDSVGSQQWQIPSVDELLGVLSAL